MATFPGLHPSAWRRTEAHTRAQAQLAEAHRLRDAAQTNVGSTRSLVVERERARARAVDAVDVFGRAIATAMERSD